MSDRRRRLPARKVACGFVPGLALGSALGCVVLVSAACASARSFDDLVEERRYEEAARTFETDSALQASPGALLLAAHFYADRTLSTHDPARARAALERLSRDFPEASEAERGRPLLQLLTELARVEEDLRARTVDLDRRAALTDSLDAARAAVAQDLETMRRRVQLIEADLEEARRELERLKAVDLRPRPGAPR